MLVLLCQAEGQRYALDPREVVEVTPRVGLRPVPGAPDWIAGLCVYRGQVTPVIDLAYLTTGCRCPVRWSNRILFLTVPGGEASRLCGVLVGSVTTGEMPEQQRAAATGPACVTPWGPVLLDEQGTFQVLNTSRLLSPERCAQLFLPGTEPA